MAKAGWHRVTRGWYRYTNAAGKVLAYVEQVDRLWQIEVLPMADAARAFNLSTQPSTYREAKRLAQVAYTHTTRVCLEEDRASIARTAAFNR